MYEIERVRYIQSQIDRGFSVNVENLAKQFKVSLITVRRDLKRLESQGKITRTHGGAVSKDPELNLNHEEFYADKVGHNHDIKVKMAQKCIDLVPDGSSIYLDSGTSTFEVASLLGIKKDITVFTSDIRIAVELMRSDVRTVIAGGAIQNNTGSILGSTAEHFIKQIHVDFGILGVASVSSTGVLHTPTMEKAALKRQAILSSRKRILLADITKFETTSLWEICPLFEFNHIITNVDFTKKQWEQHGASSLNVIPITSRHKQ